MNLEEIIMAQQDEPDQKNCIYMMRSETNDLEKFYQIRVKSREFLQKSATAIYFYDVSQQVKAFQLGDKLIRQEKQNKRF